MAEDEKKEHKISSTPTTPTKRPNASPHATPPPTVTRDGIELIDVSLPLSEGDRKKDHPIIRMTPPPTVVRSPSASDGKDQKGRSITASPMKNGNNPALAKSFAPKPQPFFFSLKNFLRLYGLAMVTVMLSWAVGTMGVMLTFDPQLLPFEMAAQLSSGLGIALLGVGAIMGAVSLVYLCRQTGSIPNSLLFTIGLMAFTVTPHYWASQPGLLSNFMWLGPILVFGAMCLVAAGFSLLWKNAEAHEVNKRYGVLLAHVEGNEVERAKLAWDQFVHLYPNHAQEMSNDILSALSNDLKNSKDTTLEIAYHFLTHPRIEKQSKQRNDKTAVTAGEIIADKELCDSVSEVLADRAFDDPVQASILLEKLYRGKQAQIITTFKASHPQEAVIAYAVLGESKGGASMESTSMDSKSNPLNPALVAVAVLHTLSEEESADVFRTLLEKKNEFLTQVAATLQIQHFQKEAKHAVSNFAYLLENHENHALALLDQAIKTDPKQTAGLIAATIDSEGRAAEMLVEALSTPGKTNQRHVMLFNLARYCPRWFSGLLTQIHSNGLKPLVFSMVQEGCSAGQEVDFLPLLQVLIRSDQQIASYLLNAIINSRENIVDVTQRRNISTFIEHGTWGVLVNENEEELLKILELTLGGEPNIDEFKLERIIALACHLPENKSIEVLANLVIRLPHIRAQNQFLQELNDTSPERFQKVVALLARHSTSQTLTALASFGIQDKEDKYSVTAPKRKDVKSKVSPPELPLLKEALQVLNGDVKAKQIVKAFAQLTQNPRDIPLMNQAVALLLEFSKQNPPKAAKVFLLFCKTNNQSAAEWLKRAGLLNCSEGVAVLISRIVKDFKEQELLHLTAAMEMSGHSTNFLSHLSDMTNGVEQIKELIDTLIDHKGMGAAIAFAKNIASLSIWKNSNKKFDLLIQLARSTEGLSLVSRLIFEIPGTINDIFLTQEEIVADKDKKQKEKGSKVTEFLINIYNHLHKQEKGILLIKKVISQPTLSAPVKFIFLQEQAKHLDELYGIIKADPDFCRSIDSILRDMATEGSEEVYGFLNSIKSNQDVWVPLHGAGENAVIISDSDSVSFQSVVKKYLPNKVIESPGENFSSRYPKKKSSAKNQNGFSMRNLFNSSAPNELPDLKQQKKRSLTMRSLLNLVSRNSEEDTPTPPIPGKLERRKTQPKILTLTTSTGEVSPPSPSSAQTPVLFSSTTASLLSEMSSSTSSNSPDLTSPATASSSSDGGGSPTLSLMFPNLQHSFRGMPPPPHLSSPATASSSSDGGSSPTLSLQPSSRAIPPPPPPPRPPVPSTNGLS